MVDFIDSIDLEPIHKPDDCYKELFILFDRAIKRGLNNDNDLDCGKIKSINKRAVKIELNKSVYDSLFLFIGSNLHYLAKDGDTTQEKALAIFQEQKVIISKSFIDNYLPFVDVLEIALNKIGLDNIITSSKKEKAQIKSAQESLYNALGECPENFISMYSVIKLGHEATVTMECVLNNQQNDQNCIEQLIRQCIVILSINIFDCVKGGARSWEDCYKQELNYPHKVANDCGDVRGSLNCQTLEVELVGLDAPYVGV